MTAFTTLLASFAGSALLLALIAGGILLSLEELLRKFVNGAIVKAWLKRFGHIRSFKWVKRWTSLPYRQFTGAIAATLRTDMSLPNKSDSDDSDNSDKAHGTELQETFINIGMQIAGVGEDIELLLYAGGDYNSPEEGNDRLSVLSSSLTDRALDDLQAGLASGWLRFRYSLSAVAAVATFSIIQTLMARDFANLLELEGAWPAMLIVAAFFAPLFRDAIAGITRSQQ